MIFIFNARVRKSEIVRWKIEEKKRVRVRERGRGREREREIDIVLQKDNHNSREHFDNANI